MKPCSFGLQVLILEYKNLLVKKNNKILTALSFLFPILIFGSIAYARNELGSIRKVYVKEPIYNYDISEDLLIEQYKFDLEQTELYYSPNSTFVEEEIIRDVQLRMSMVNNAITGFNTEEDLMKHYHEQKPKNVFAVVFHEVHNKLSYDIRHYNEKVNWKTKQLFVHSDNYEPGTGSSEYFHNGFLALQAAIDTAFIRSKNESARNAYLSLQELPYPPHYKIKGMLMLLTQILPICLILADTTVSLLPIGIIMVEKKSGINALSKSMGLSMRALWISWLLDSLIRTVIVNMVIVVILTNTWGEATAILEQTNGYLLFLVLCLYCISSMSYYLLIAAFTSHPQFIIYLIATFAATTTMIPYLFGDYLYTFHVASKFFMCLFPNVGLFYAFKSIATHEQEELHLGFKNVFTPQALKDIPLGFILIAFLISILLTITLILYFGCRASIGKKKTTEYVYAEEEALICSDGKKGTLERAITLNNVSKYFDKYKTKIALNQISMNIYKGETIVLLGMNGAGKTTLMSIISGIMDPSEGNVHFSLVSPGEENSERARLGICSQEDNLLPDISVENHLLIFGWLNTIDKKSVKEKVSKILDRLDLQKVADNLPGQLSGGMKRKLSLGIALVTDPQVLILDEPTTGVDSESTQEIWNILLKWKKDMKNECAIILSTHYMEEAEKLADRIALLQLGKLADIGTPLYLKNKYKTGNRISLNRELCDEFKIRDENLCKDISGNADIKFTNNCISINNVLDNGKLLAFVKKMEEYDAGPVHVESSSFEDIFMKLSAETLTSTKESEEQIKKISIDMPQNDERAINENEKKSKYRTNQFLTLCQMQGFYYFRSKMIILYVVYILMAFGATALANIASIPNEFFPQSSYGFNIDLSNYGKTLAFVHASDSNIHSMASFYEGLLFKNGMLAMVSHESVSNDAIKFGTDDLQKYLKDVVVSAEFNNTSNGIVANALYSTTALHGASISLNLVTNVLAKFYLGENASISTTNYPLPRPSNGIIDKFDRVKYSMTMAMLLPIGPTLLLLYFTFYIHSNRKSMEMIRLMGVSTFCYKFQIYVVNFVLYLITISFICVIVKYTLFYDWYPLAPILFIVSMYGATSLPLIHLVTSMNKKHLLYCHSLYNIGCLWLGSVTFLLILALKTSGNSSYESVADILHYVACTIPPYWISTTVFNVTSKATEIYNWRNSQSSNKFDHYCRFNYNPCCDNGNSTECKNFESFADNIFNINLIPLILVCAIIIIFPLLSSLRKDISKKIRGCSCLKSEGDTLKIFKCDSLSKKYKKRHILTDLKFEVDKKECFGVLGANGAGKTTLLKMLSLELTELSRKGKAWIKNNTIQQCWHNEDDYQKSLGYCPQTDPLNSSLTVKQTLTVYARLCGRPSIDVQYIMDKFGLLPFENTLLGKCSGGNRRKVTVALSTLKHPTILILDEPTNGIDPKARRFIWDFLKEEKNKESGIILTSHNFDETDVLCDRVGMMLSGTISEKDLGALKNSRNQFYFITMKINNFNRSEAIIGDINGKIVRHIGDIWEVKVPIESGSKLSELLNTLDKLREKGLEDYNFKRASLAEICNEYLQEKSKQEENIGEKN